MEEPVAEQAADQEITLEEEWLIQEVPLADARDEPAPADDWLVEDYAESAGDPSEAAATVEEVWLVSEVEVVSEASPAEESWSVEALGEETDAALESDTSELVAQPWVDEEGPAFAETTPEEGAGDGVSVEDDVLAAFGAPGEEAAGSGEGLDMVVFRLDDVTVDEVASDLDIAEDWGGAEAIGEDEAAFMADSLTAMDDLVDEAEAAGASDVDIVLSAATDSWTGPVEATPGSDSIDEPPADSWETEAETVADAAYEAEITVELSDVPELPLAGEEQPWDALGRALKEAITWADLPPVEEPLAAEVGAPHEMVDDAVPGGIEDAIPAIEDEWAAAEPHAASTAAPEDSPAADPFSMDVAVTLESLAERLRRQGLGALGDAISRGDRLEASIALFLAGYRAGRDG